MVSTPKSKAKAQETIPKDPFLPIMIISTVGLVCTMLYWLGRVP